ncbi:MAG: Carboxy-S-adenosyl-L-methionine synthase [Turneriella sp.]|nr:Carboxy-S-adenosyl-L-methionine synthase [Turneriella sp.]
MKDKIFDNPGSGKIPFEFNAQVVDVFDDMVSRSVPFYREVLQITAELTHEFFKPGTVIYDLGSSTGALPKALLAEFKNEPFNYIGMDTSKEMLRRAKEEFSTPQYGKNKILFEERDIAQANFENASVVVASYTLQFLRPLVRQALLTQIFSDLTSGGCFILSEKCLEDSSDISRLYADRYHALKERNGYSKLEIAEKRDALENVLIPFRVSENTEMLKIAGFNPVSIFFKCFNFVSILAIKQ